MNVKLFVRHSSLNVIDSVCICVYMYVCISLLFIIQYLLRLYLCVLMYIIFVHHPLHAAIDTVYMYVCIYVGTFSVSLFPRCD